MSEWTSEYLYISVHIARANDCRRGSGGWVQVAGRAATCWAVNGSGWEGGMVARIGSSTLSPIVPTS